MRFTHRQKTPTVHETAYVAPNAVVSGDVAIGSGCRILFGAVITSEGGPVRLGRDCVVMENAIIRGTPGHPTVIGDRVLVGPHAYATGCVVEDDSFLATGSTVFTGATIGKESEVRINAIVHVNSAVAAGSLVPIGWIAVGAPAQVFPPSKHTELWPIQKSMNFSQTVWGRGSDVPWREKIERYTKSLGRHADDRATSDSSTRDRSQ